MEGRNIFLQEMNISYYVPLKSKAITVFYELGTVELYTQLNIN